MITTSIGTIGEPKQNLLKALGANKVKAIAAAVKGLIMVMNPAFILQMHPVAKLCFEQGVGQLRRADYCRWVHINKPDCQQS